MLVSIFISATVFCVAVAIALSVLNQLRSKAQLGCLPPGPTRLPLIGSLLSLPKRNTINEILSLEKITYFNIFGTGILYIKSADVALDLLEKRGSIYSSRPRLVFGGEMCGQELMIPLMKNDEKFKLSRKWTKSVLGPQTLHNWDNAITQEAHTLAINLLDGPEGMLNHIRRFSGALILRIIYGYKVEGPQDRFITLAEESMAISTDAIGQPRAVNFFPILKYLPEWAPGAGFKRNARAWKAQINNFATLPYDYVLETMKTSEYVSSFTSELLLQASSREEKELVKWVSCAVFGAGLESTAALITSFILAMALYPTCQRKAQVEIDAHLHGSNIDKLPTLQHRNHLPYVNALFRECLRWACPIPFAVPHEVERDDTYNEWFIPKGTMCIVSIWSILNDESLYPKPAEFEPSRFIHSSGKRTGSLNPDPEKFLFGFGRRRCPGVHLASDSAWLAIATILTTCSISAIDELSLPSPRWTEGEIRHPLAFPCRITRRS